MNRVIAAAGLVIASAGTVFASQEAQGGFVSANSLPPAEQIPAAPLLVAAYIFVWVALMGYLWSIWSRIGRVEKDIETLRARAGRK